MIPDCVLPNKHYAEETITDVLDDILSTDDALDSPSESTMIRWHHWLIMNTFNIDGHLKSIAFRKLGFTEELLKS